MAQEWFSKGALAAELQYIIDGAETIHLLNAYTAGQDYATVVAASIGSVTIGSGNFSAIIDGTPTTSQRMSFTGITTDGVNTLTDAGGSLFIAIVKTSATSEVLAVTDETTNQPITALNPLTFPTFYMQANQPIAAA